MPTINPTGTGGPGGGGGVFSPANKLETDKKTMAMRVDRRMSEALMVVIASSGEQMYECWMNVGCGKNIFYGLWITNYACPDLQNTSDKHNP